MLPRKIPFSPPHLAPTVPPLPSSPHAHTRCGPLGLRQFWTKFNASPSSGTVYSGFRLDQRPVLQRRNTRGEPYGQWPTGEGGQNITTAKYQGHQSAHWPLSPEPMPPAWARLTFLLPMISRGAAKSQPLGQQHGCQ